MSLRRGIGLALACFFFGPLASAIAQDNPTPDAVKNMEQTLKRDQDRISQLAHENEQLQAKVKELQKDLDAAQADKNALNQKISDDAEKSYFLRSFHAAWEAFIAEYPDVMLRWKAFMDDDQFSGGTDPTSFMDSRWPLPARG